MWNMAKVQENYLHGKSKRQRKRAFHSIMDLDGNITIDPATINTTFRSFYQELYRSENTISIESIHSFLDGVVLPSISESDKLDLDKDFSQEELIKAIQKLQNGKSPGSDGLPIEFYKCFLSKILNLFKNIIEAALKKNKLPDSHIGHHHPLKKER